LCFGFIQNDTLSMQISIANFTKKPIYVSSSDWFFIYLKEDVPLDIYPEFPSFINVIEFFPGPREILDIEMMA